MQPCVFFMENLGIKKIYYSISEVAKLLDLEQYVLRYWETEFSQLRPNKNRNGNRAYTEKDIELLKNIKRLTRDEGLTLEGARRALKHKNQNLERVALGKPSYEELEADLIKTKELLKYVLSRLNGE